MLIAVYGTLKKGEENYSRFLSGREPSFRGFVEIPYRMFSNGAHPMLVPAAERHPILVEVYEVEEETLRELDGFESPYGYARETVRLTERGLSFDIYVHASPSPHDFKLVESGDWKTGT